MGTAAEARRIKTHRIYTVWEAAEALGKHRKTVIRWVKDKGLVADQSRRPWLIRGDDLRAFLGARVASRKCALKLHELYCLVCKSAQEPDGKFGDYHHETAATGMLKALCPACGVVMNKKIRRADLEAIRAKIDVTIQQALPRLMSGPEACENVTISNEKQTHAKTQYQ